MLPTPLGAKQYIYKIMISTVSILALPYPEHFGPTYGAHTLSSWLTILHGYALGIFHFPFSAAFDTICLHESTSLFN